MKSLLQRITPFLIALYLIIVLSGTTNADFEIISERKLVEKVVIDSVSTKGKRSLFSKRYVNTRSIKIKLFHLKLTWSFFLFFSFWHKDLKIITSDTNNEYLRIVLCEK